MNKCATMPKYKGGGKMRYIEIDEQQKNVPVFKNVIYALKITWKADKRLLLGYILQEGFFAIFSKYIFKIFCF